jgi:hypothetical protein
VPRPGQRQILVVMGDVIEPFPVRAGLIVRTCSSRASTWLSTVRRKAASR